MMNPQFGMGMGMGFGMGMGMGMGMQGNQFMNNSEADQEWLKGFQMSYQETYP